MRFARKSSEPSDDEQADHVAERLHIVSALAEALSQPERLMRVISTSETPDDARTHLQDVFSLDELQAAAVMDAQFRRSAVTEVRKLREYRDELEDELRRLRG